MRTGWARALKKAALKVWRSATRSSASVLRANNVVVGRKTGVSVRYTVRDQLVSDLLVVARQIFNNQLSGTQHLLRQLRKEHRQQSRR